MAHGGRARGEMGGGTREQCGSNTGSLFLGSLWSDLAGDEGGGMGGGVGRWAGKGGDGGGTREQCGSNKRCTESLLPQQLV